MESDEKFIFEAYLNEINNPYEHENNSEKEMDRINKIIMLHNLLRLKLLKMFFLNENLGIIFYDNDKDKIIVAPFKTLSITDLSKIIYNYDLENLIFENFSLLEHEFINIEALFKACLSPQKASRGLTEKQNDIISNVMKSNQIEDEYLPNYNLVNGYALVDEFDEMLGGEIGESS